MADAKQVSSGVQELIARLRGEGVEAGRQEAARVLSEAQKQAEQMVEAARREARQHVDAAREAVSRERLAMIEALRMAQRDAVLALKAELTRMFTEHLQRLVHAQLREPAILADMVTRFLGAGIQPDHDSAAADDLLARVARDLLAQGVALQFAQEPEAGLRAVLDDRGLELHLTDAAVSALLARHLLPRFQAVLDGKAD